MLIVTYVECHIYAPFAECLYAECRYADCHYAECRIALISIKDNWCPEFRPNVKNSNVIYLNLS